MSRTSANLLMLVAGLLWGAGFVAQETAMDDIGPFLFMTIRFFIAGLAILPFALREFRTSSEFRRAMRVRDWISVATVGVIFFLAMALQQVGLLATTVTNAGVLTGLYVVLVPLMALAFFRDPQPTIIWPCAMAAFLGIWLLGGGGLDKLTSGDWLVIICAVFAALHVIAVGRTVVDLRRPATVACAQFLISSLLAGLGFAFARLLEWEKEPPIAVDTLIAAAPEILYAALLAGALAFTIMAVCQQYTSASAAAILLSSESLFAAIGGAIILGERLTMIGYAGCLVLFIAIATISFASGRQEDRVAAA